jgi:hypothetical protein
MIPWLGPLADWHQAMRSSDARTRGYASRSLLRPRRLAPRSAES